MGSKLIERLLQNKHQVHALVRRGSEKRLTVGAHPVIGNALDKSTFVNSIRPATMFVHLVGVSHPNPAKKNQFREIDFVSARESVSAAFQSGVQHFIYVSVASPAPVMKAYVDVRIECENMIKESGMNCTILRPLYVLGPGHWWPYPLKPIFLMLEQIPAIKEPAQRLGFVTLQQMVNTLVWSVEHPATGVRILDVLKIKQYGQ